jgi:hypothetical protein
MNSAGDQADTVGEVANMRTLRVLALRAFGQGKMGGRYYWSGVWH